MDTSLDETLNGTDNRKRNRDQLCSCSSEDSFSCSSPVCKKPNKANMSSDLEQTLAALQKSQESIIKAQESMQASIDKLAKSDDVEKLRTDLYSEINRLNTRLDRWTKEYEDRVEALESKFMDFENIVDSVRKENQSLRSENETLKEDIRCCQRQMNDLEQYGRRWNLKIFNVVDNRKESPNETKDKALEVFNATMGLKVAPQDIEACHRLPAVDNTKKRPIIVRFRDRGLRDSVWDKKTSLKGKGVSLSEDLTVANAKMLKDAFKHEHCKSTWSMSGKCYARLENGHRVRLKLGENVNGTIKEGMKLTPIVRDNPPEQPEPVQEDQEAME